MSKNLKELQNQLIKYMVATVSGEDKQEYDKLINYNKKRLNLMASMMVGNHVWSLEKILPTTIKYIHPQNDLFQYILKHYFAYRKPSGDTFLLEARNFYEFIMQWNDTILKQAPYLKDILSFELALANVKYAYENHTIRYATRETLYYSLTPLSQLVILNYDIRCFFKKKRVFNLTLKPKKQSLLITCDQLSHQIRIFEVSDSNFSLLKMAQHHFLSYPMNKNNKFIQYLIERKILENRYENLFYW